MGAGDIRDRLITMQGDKSQNGGLPFPKGLAAKVILALDRISLELPGEVVFVRPPRNGFNLYWLGPELAALLHFPNAQISRSQPPSDLIFNSFNSACSQRESAIVSRDAKSL